MITHHCVVRLKSTSEFLSSGPVNIRDRDSMEDVACRAANIAISLWLLSGEEIPDEEPVPPMEVDFGPVQQ